ncbi:protein expanded [Cydia pomonella]|uniref:protein expanded n=1 Tax=Cydia pomonella TaxID=82600 RepID=UPI002ADDC398|nr:protein expanded [Cydia pomonella]XP_061729860.1 protein expanded [Cydia pomonella]
MRALCSVRGPLGGETRALGAGARLLSLRVPGRAQPLHFVVEAKARVKELKALASTHAQLQGMTDTDYFGLAILQNGEYLFVDQESKLSKYAPKSWRSSHTHGLDANGKPLLELHLVIQFHIESPLLLQDEVGLHLYFLQLRHNVRTREGLPTEVLLLLTGLALQAEYGDADTYEDRDYFKVEDYATPSLTGDWVAAAMRACHREHRGLSKNDAKIRFIREVCLLPDTINSHRYRMKQTKSEPEPGTVWLLVTAKGIQILPDNGSVYNFIWSSIGKLSFDRKKFEIKTEEGKITLYSSSDEKCKYLFALCKESHQFSMKIAPKFNEILKREEEERKVCYGYSKSLNLHHNQHNKSEQRISVISTTSSNTTSGIVSDRVQSEDELEIMIDSPPAPSTESLAFAHLLDSSNSYFLQNDSKNSHLLHKTTSLQLRKSKLNQSKSMDENESSKLDTTSEIVLNNLGETVSLPDHSISESKTDSPVNKSKCTGSQCSSSCSTVVMARAALSTLSRASNASSLELGFSHTAQNSMMSDNSTVGIDVEYSQDTESALYDGLGQPMTIAASSETSGVYTMGSSELTARSKIGIHSEGSRTEYESSHYDSYKPSEENDLAAFDSVSSILKNKAEPSRSTGPLIRLQASLLDVDCVDGDTKFTNQKHDDKENILYRERSNSNVSAVSFHGDGSDPTDQKHNLLSASELSDLIVGRGVYPKSQSVSDTLDSVSDYVRLPLPFSGDSYIQGHEDTAPSDDNYPNGSFFDRPPTPPTRTDSRKVFNLSLPNILDIDRDQVMSSIAEKPPPPPYDYNHKTVPAHTSINTKAPPSYPGSISHGSFKNSAEKEEVAARVVTSKPMITILKAEAGDVNTPSERTFASPMVMEHRFQKSKRHQASSRRAGRSKLAQGISSLSPSREMPSHVVDANVLVAMMKLPPPPPPRRTRLPPPPPIARLPPPPPPHNPMFHQQLYSDVDYVYYPLQDPTISQQNYLDHKFSEPRVSNMHKSGLQYRSTPFLSTNMSTSSMYGSIQNLSDSYIQLPGNRSSWYSLTSKTSLSNYSVNLERPQIPIRTPEVSNFPRTKSDDNLLNPRDPPPIRSRRMPPPPPPPYEHKKKLSAPLREVNISNSGANVMSELSKVRDANGDLDIKTLREKSKNLDLPLIAALCNDRSLLKQTKAFGVPKLHKQTVSESERKCTKSVLNTTDNLELKNNHKQEGNARMSMTGSQKKILIRKPTDKLPALPSSDTHTPRALSNTYVMHPSVKVKKIQPSS